MTIVAGPAEALSWRFTARILGLAGNTTGITSCVATQWQYGDGQALVGDPFCPSGTPTPDRPVPYLMAGSHTYAAAGSYDVTARYGGLAATLRVTVGGWSPAPPFPTPSPWTPGAVSRCGNLDLEDTVVQESMARVVPGSGAQFPSFPRTFSCSSNRSTGVSTEPSRGHRKELVIERYGSEAAARAALVNPNTTFHASLAFRQSGHNSTGSTGAQAERLVWVAGVYLFTAGASDDTLPASGPNVVTLAETLYAVAGERGLVQPGGQPPPLPRTHPLAVTLLPNAQGKYGRLSISPTPFLATRDGCDTGCTVSYQEGTRVILTVFPAPGIVFFGWSGACTGTQPCALTMDSPKAVSGSFYDRGPVTGSVEIEGGASVRGGRPGATIPLNVAFRAAATTGSVTEMRVRPGGGCATEGDMASLPWEPFAAQKTYQTTAPGSGFIGFYVSAQYRDAQGNLSAVYCDDISIEGFRG